MDTGEWSKSEKEIARRAFNLAYTKECKAIEEELRKKVSELHDPKGLWGIHDYLSEKRRDTDRKYDYRYSVLPSVFASLLYEGWITLVDLKGLSEQKVDNIKRMAEFAKE
jgi:hypothetical protein